MVSGVIKKFCLVIELINFVINILRDQIELELCGIKYCA